MQLSLMKMINMNNIVLGDSFVKDGIVSKVIDRNGNYVLNLKDINCDVRIEIVPNVSISITEINVESIDNNIIYDLGENSNVDINIFDDSSNSRRNITINLNGISSKVNFHAGIISHNENKYKLNVFHNKNNTISNINIHGITIDNSKILIENNGYIPNGSYKSSLKQDNKIITMGSNNSKIEPNLYIDEYDVEASHGAYIGKFEDDILFYLNSRGLDYESSYSLLIRGFLLEEFNIDDSIKEDILKIINKYWR